MMCPGIPPEIEICAELHRLGGIVPRGIQKLVVRGIIEYHASLGIDSYCGEDHISVIPKCTMPI